ncbi:MAG TPA: YfhO family protein, partial [Chitinophagaceae bacterium]|nr:YfhO family protein [Chitinophagaceae bacterium]
WKAVRNTLLLTGAIILILWSGMLLDFSGPRDPQLVQMLGGDSPVAGRIMNALREDRAALLHTDGFRSLVLILIAGVLLWAFVKGRIKLRVFAALFCVLMLFDLVGVDKRYVNNDQFMEQDDLDHFFQPSQADQAILQDKDPYYRVLNLAFNDPVNDPFNDAVTSYFHKSIGGYSPAKLWRYQDLIDFQIQPAIQRIVSVFQGKGPKDSTMLKVFHTSPVLNMLNTKYFILNPQAPPVRNREACGNAWFVRSVHEVPDANQEILSLTDFNPLDSAIVEKTEMKGLEGFTPGKDSASYVRLTRYGLNELQYSSSNSQEGLAVFSDIYYPAGWTALIDGKASPILRVNYALRALKVPAGNHQIIFRFHPQTYFTGEEISLVSSLLILLLLALGLVWLAIREFPAPEPRLA